MRCVNLCVRRDAERARESMIPHKQKGRRGCGVSVRGEEAKGIICLWSDVPAAAAGVCACDDSGSQVVFVFFELLTSCVRCDVSCGDSLTALCDGVCCP